MKIKLPKQQKNIINRDMKITIMIWFSVVFIFDEFLILTFYLREKKIHNSTPVDGWEDKKLSIYKFDP